MKQVEPFTPRGSASCREYLLILGTLFFTVSPLLVIVFYAAAAGATLLLWRQLRLNKEKIAIGVVILIISLWMMHRKVIPEVYSPGSVAFTDYVPPFIFFYIISLVPFSDSESEHFSYALLSTVPQHFIIAFGEKYYHWYGPTQYFVNGAPIIDIFVGPFERGIATSSTLYNPNILALYGVMVFAVSCGLLLMEIKGVRLRARALFWPGVRIASASLCSLLALFIIMWTHSRNGLAALIFVFIAFSCWIGKKGVLLLKAVTAVMIIFLLLSLFNLGFPAGHAIHFVPAAIAERFSDLYDSSFFRIRSDIYADAIQLIKERPLEGWGIGMFKSDGGLPKRFGYRAAHTHNILLQLAVEIGLPFTILIVCLFSYIFIISLRRLRRKDIDDKSKVPNLDMLFLITVSAVLSMQIFDLALLMTYRLNFLFWICFAIVYSRAFKLKQIA